jgi:hypothetical protein
LTTKRRPAIDHGIINLCSHRQANRRHVRLALCMMFMLSLAAAAQPFPDSARQGNWRLVSWNDDAHLG